MTEFEKFNKIWNGNFQQTTRTGHKHRPFTDRGWEHKTTYENILFSIWKHHPDWDINSGFQIKSQDRTVYRVIELAEKTGLLIKVGNYSVNRFTRKYHKNHTLFDIVFRNQDNLYGNWLNNTGIKNNNKTRDIIHDHLITPFASIPKNTYKPYIDTSSEIIAKKQKKLNYDLAKLHILCEKMLPYYLKLKEKLNDNVCHDDLKIFTWLKFDNEYLPTGRPYSYFCSTLNRNKKHKVIDPSMEYRDVFLKRVGLPDYYEVYDMKSQIPRINYLFHTGVWKDDNYDFYDEIINDYHKRCPDPDGDKIARGKAGSLYYNDSMKKLFMRVYFGKGTEGNSFLGYKNEYMKRNIENWNEVKNLISNFNIEDFIPITFDDWYEICCSVENICGKSIGILIFWYAFFIETEIKIELLKRGKTVYNVYDGFYYNSDIKEEIIEIMNEKAKYIYNKYMKPIKP